MIDVQLLVYLAVTVESCLVQDLNLQCSTKLTPLLA